MGARLEPKVRILSPELRKRIEDKVRECLDKAGAEYKRKFEMPEIRYDVKNTDG